MFVQQRVPKLLLTNTRHAWGKPVRVWQIQWIDNVYTRTDGRIDPQRRQYVRNRVQGFKSFVNRHLEYRCRGVERAVNNVFGTRDIPAAADAEGTFAAVPCGRVHGLIQAPGNQACMTRDVR